MLKLKTFILTMGLSLSLLTNTTSAFERFIDIEDSYASSEIEYLDSKGYLNGIDGINFSYFEPRKPLTRAQFTVILSRALNLPIDLDAESKFKDLPTWAIPHVESALTRKLVFGRSKNEFDPTGTIDREQAASIMVRALQYIGKPVNLNVRSHFKDEISISKWALPYVGAAESAGIFRGYNGLFAPKDKLTREQGVTIIYNFLKQFDPEVSLQIEEDSIKTSEQLLLEEQLRKFEEDRRRYEDAKTTEDRLRKLAEERKKLEELKEKLAEQIADREAEYGTNITLPTPSISNTGFINVASDETSYKVYGTSSALTTIEIEMTDGNKTVKKTGLVSASGTYEVLIPTTDFEETNVVISALSKDKKGGRSLPFMTSVKKDLTIPPDTQIFNVNPINNANETAYEVYGLGEPGHVVSVWANTFVDSPRSTPTARTIVRYDGTYRIPINASILPDGNVTLTTTQANEAGNESEPVEATVTKQTTLPSAPTISQHGYLNTDRKVYSVKGTAVPSSTVDYLITDGIETTSGTLSVDALGNYAFTFGVRTFNPQTTKITIIYTDSVNGGKNKAEVVGLLYNVNSVDLNVNTPAPVNVLNQASYPVSGRGIPSWQIDVEVSDGTQVINGTGVVLANKTFSIPLNLTTLLDRPLTITTKQTDPSTMLLKDTVAVPTDKDVVPPTAVVNGTISGTEAALGTSTDGLNELHLSFTPSTDIDIREYEVYFSTVSGTLGSLAATVPANPNSTANLTMTRNVGVSMTYYVTVVAVDTAGNETPSTQISYTTTTDL